MSTVTILCKTPGFRRLGKAHAAAETYEAGHWTKEDLAIFESDPNFSVIIDRGEAAPIPGLVGGGSAGDHSLFLSKLSVRLESFFNRLDALIEVTLSRLANRPNVDVPGADVEREALRLWVSDIMGQPITFMPVGVEGPGAPVQPAAVAPGADVSDAVQDNGTGPAINDLGAKSDGLGPSAAIGTADGLRPPIFDDGRIQAIRATLKTFDPATDFAGVPGRPHRKKLREQLGFEPSAAEIAEARVEAVAPEATVTT